MPHANVFVSCHSVNLDITVITLTIPEHVVCVRFVLIAYNVNSHDEFPALGQKVL